MQTKLVNKKGRHLVIILKLGTAPSLGRWQAATARGFLRGRKLSVFSPLPRPSRETTRFITEGVKPIKTPDSSALVFSVYLLLPIK